MATDAQNGANRANSQNSTGPRTEPGKAAASQNALKYGLYARRVLLPGEDPELYDALLGALREEHNPSGPTECFLVEKIAESQWKSNRISEMETRLLTPPAEVYEQCPELTPAQLASCVFQHDAGNQGILEKLARYEANVRRAHDQYLRQLLFLQRNRRANQQKVEQAGEQARKQQAADLRHNRNQAGKAVEQYLESLFAEDGAPLPPGVEAELNAPVCKTKPISGANGKKAPADPGYNG